MNRPSSPADDLRKYTRTRAPFVLFMALFAAAATLRNSPPPAKSKEAVAEWLGKSVRGTVAPNDFIWEHGGGFWLDAFYGRSVLFLAQPVPNAASEGESNAELYRARVLLTRAGRPLSIHSIKNLSKTPLGHETNLQGWGNFIAFTTIAFNTVQGISVLDLSGDRPDREAKTRWQGIAAALENFADTGSFSGLGRIEIAFGRPPAELYSELSDHTLWMTPDNPTEHPRVFSLDLHTLAFSGDAQALAEPHAQRIPHPIRPLSPTLLALSEMSLGTGARVWLQGWLAPPAITPPSSPSAPPKQALWPIPPSKNDLPPTPPEDGWPPVRIIVPMPPSFEGEGVWTASQSPLLPERKAIQLPQIPVEMQAPEPPPPETNTNNTKNTKNTKNLDAGTDVDTDADTDAGEPDEQDQADAGIPATPIELPAPAPPFYQTQYRPDAAHTQRPVLAVAMDMRQLELHVEAGYDEPRPVTGPRGSGRLPRGPDAASVVAAFLGGKPAGFPELGMIVHQRILVPPSPNAPSLLLAQSGHVFMGPWIFEQNLPPTALSLRQSPLWLLQDGAVPAHPAYDPTHSMDSQNKELETNISGPQKKPAKNILSAGQTAERSALCVTQDGHLIYFYAPGIDQPGLAQAAHLAGCVHALHLGSAPARMGFAFVRAQNNEQDYEAEILSPAMSASSDLFTQASPGELWYLSLKPNHPSASAPWGAEWRPEIQKPSHPPWLPALYTSHTMNLGADVALYYLAPERFAFRLRAGSRERSPKKGIRFQSALDQAEKDRAALIIGLGVGRRKGGPPRGFGTAGTIGIPIRKEAAVLMAGDHGLMLLRSDDMPETFEGDATELAMTADEGAITPEGRRVGMRRPRACICVLGDGAVLIAHTIFDSDEAATEVLIKAGCQRVAGLDRGSQSAAFITRVHAGSPLLAHHETSLLVAVDLEMKGRASLLQ